MLKQALAFKSVRFLAAIGFSLMIMAGCTYGRGYYGFHWSYCKFFGYPKLLTCIAPPPADSSLIPDVPPYPPDNQRTVDKEKLGKLLFIDKRLSSNGVISCASCHVPENGFADPRRLSIGINDQIGRRNAPTVLNTAFHRFLFWDGRAGSLEEQAEGPIENEKEMGPKGNLGKAVERLNADQNMKAQFQRAFGSPEVTATGIVMALATFERALISRDTAFERWVREEEPMPSWSAERGWELFHGKALCSGCHVPFLYTDGVFHNIGVRRHPADAPDTGRHEYLISQANRGKPVDLQEAEKNKCAFRTPSLLHVADTAPYMHNGTLDRLEDVISFYVRFDPQADYARVDPQADDQGCGKIDLRIVALKGMLTPEEQMELVEFLRSLSPGPGAYREFLKRLGLPAGQQGAAKTVPARSAARSLTATPVISDNATP